MINFTTTQILNSEDANTYTVLIEWESDSTFTVFLMKPNFTPMMGKVSKDDIKYFSEALEKTEIDYINQTKCIFSMQCPDIQFLFNMEYLEWRRKGILTLGKVILEPITNINILCAVMEQLSQHHQNLGKKLENLEKENEYFKKTNKRLTFDIEEMIVKKNSMEVELYKSFLLILNSKKKRIRELENKLKRKTVTKKSRFQMDTESDTTEDEETTKTEIKNKNSKVNDQEESDFENNKGLNEILTISKNIRTDETSRNLIPRPSTSKESTVYFMSSDEVDDDMVLRYSDSPTSLNSSNKLDLTEDQSEKELFSD
ncbi:DNA repair protein XRCC4 [Prorops nasuta]|uniref:DNA repair protein XRCC4 n=1 Tax=Prorops nasuta TaxID=863751 RepID=UPI0034CF6815